MHCPLSIGLANNHIPEWAIQTGPCDNDIHSAQECSPASYWITYFDRNNTAGTCLVCQKNTAAPSSRTPAATSRKSQCNPNTCTCTCWGLWRGLFYLSELAHIHRYIVVTTRNVAKEVQLAPSAGAT